MTRARIHNLAILGLDVVHWDELVTSNWVIPRMDSEERHTNLTSPVVDTHFVVVVLFVFETVHLDVDVLIKVVKSRLFVQSLAELLELLLRHKLLHLRQLIVLYVGGYGLADHIVVQASSTLDEPFIAFPCLPQARENYCTVKNFTRFLSDFTEVHEENLAA